MHYALSQRRRVNIHPLWQTDGPTPLFLPLQLSQPLQPYRLVAPRSAALQPHYRVQCPYRWKLFHFTAAPSKDSPPPRANRWRTMHSHLSLLERETSFCSCVSGKSRIQMRRTILRVITVKIRTCDSIFICIDTWDRRKIYRAASRKERLAFPNHISPWFPRWRVSLFFSLFFSSLSFQRIWYKLTYSEASREKVNILCIYWRHIFPAYFFVNIRYPPRDILYKIARSSTGSQFFFIEGKRLQSYTVIERRGNPAKNSSSRDWIRLVSAKRETRALYVASPDIAPLKHAISCLLNYCSQSLRQLPSWMRASSRSPFHPLRRIESQTMIFLT